MVLKEAIKTLLNTDEAVFIRIKEDKDRVSLKFSLAERSSLC